VASPEDEERAAQELAEEFKRLRVEDVVVQALVTVSAIGYRGLGLTPETKDVRDLAQARLAIDTMRALTPVLEEVVPPELVRDFNSSVANLQLAYAGVASEETAGGEPPAGEPGEEPQAEAAEEGQADG
jgi:hypothetical protein